MVRHRAFCYELVHFQGMLHVKEGLGVEVSDRNYPLDIYLSSRIMFSLLRSYIHRLNDIKPELNQ